MSGLYNDILTKWDDTKNIWDNINLSINKKRLSSHIEKLQVENNKKKEQPFTISNCLNRFFCMLPPKHFFISFHFYLFNSYHFWPFQTRYIIQYIKCYISSPFIGTWLVMLFLSLKIKTKEGVHSTMINNENVYLVKDDKPLFVGM